MDASTAPFCALCGERIGVYEPLWWRRPDGRATPSSVLHVRDDPSYSAAGSELFHDECFALAADR